MRHPRNSPNSPPRVVVLGDGVLDVWLSGTCRRLSREGPAAVVDVEQSSVCPGAAANTAANLAALGAQTEIVTLIGNDDVGRSLRRELHRDGVGTEHAVSAAGRTTPSKSRVVASSRVLLRFDQGDPRLASEAEARQLADELTAALHVADALVICDYRGDVAHSHVFAALDAVRHRLPLLVVDGHRLGAWRSMRPDVATPSAAESMALLPDANPDGQARADFFVAQRRQLADATGADTVVVTLDSEGVLLLDGDRPPYRTAAQRAPEENCAGAGDTFAAAMTVGLLQGMSAEQATDYGQRAADVVTAQPGTSVCSRAELDERMVSGVPISSDALARRVARHRSAGHRIVFTNGCFDVLHRGHVAYLKQAKGAGDVLIVAINSDESVRRLKGWTRPINNEIDRAAVLGELSCVDYVTVFDDDTPASLIQLLRPDIYVKGGDYTADMLPETPVVRSYGGEVRTLGYVANHSTTETIARIRASVDC
ncbi:MAG TPA: D-glycero-beta-D-manno-heptose 1-phosphate adenylyltransferase [Mycobacterium sp.]|uniref:D-glycero-beta-D-manno-heptose 1-phosphate adenylyltransferase n=1 Tax=Mycobacterium sp. TaxID=1785 RepID=UPI002D6927B8|nr:D-glycero-beta-D-manno-heptose 1-phosphate adenylyltransferase [Mycobacterium sp.]HZU48959.1 D-glycero-beta-D-manno-heptose 1-phosphate adenylyltransferase [Mycobacterium sp.]